MRYTTLDGAPFTPPYGDIHHRTETLRGVSDGDLLVALAAGAALASSASAPRSPSDAPSPIRSRSAAKGKSTSTCNSAAACSRRKLEVGWSARAERSRCVQATMPLIDEQPRLPRAEKLPLERPARRSRWAARTLALSAAGQYQTIGRWHGAVDEGTGFSNGGLRLQLSLPLGGMTIAPSVYRELYSHGLNAAEHETFSQGTTVALTITRTF